MILLTLSEDRGVLALYDIEMRSVVVYVLLSAKVLALRKAIVRYESVIVGRSE